MDDFWLGFVYVALAIIGFFIGWLANHD